MTSPIDKEEKVPLYTPDQQRAADYIVEATGGNIGGGEDPVGFLIVSHATIGDNLKDARSVLTELLRLYDWRFELARMDRDGDCPGEMKGLLNQYGREKQAAWKRTREVLAGVPQSATREPVAWRYKVAVTQQDWFYSRRRPTYVDEALYEPLYTESSHQYVLEKP